MKRERPASMFSKYNHIGRHTYCNNPQSKLACTEKKIGFRCPTEKAGEAWGLVLPVEELVLDSLARVGGYPNANHFKERRKRSRNIKQKRTSAVEESSHALLKARRRSAWTRRSHVHPKSRKEGREAEMMVGPK